MLLSFKSLAGLFVISLVSPAGTRAIEPVFAEEDFLTRRRRHEDPFGERVMKTLRKRILSFRLRFRYRYNYLRDRFPRSGQA